MIVDEANLIAKIRAGDQGAFRLLYEGYADRVTGFVLRLTGSRTDTEDIVQEVFIAAYAGRASFRGDSKLLSWLLGIAVRRWRDRSRKQSLPTTPFTADGDMDAQATQVAGGSLLETEVVNSLTLARALEQLEPSFRAALLLVASQGLTYREAAEIMAEPVGTIKWRVFEATREMARLLQAIEEEYNAMQQHSEKDCSPCRR